MEISPEQIAKIKEHLKVNNSREDDLIQDYVEGAIDYVEFYCGGPLVTALTEPADGEDAPAETLFTKGIWQAILLLVGHWYANREAAAASQVEIPFGVDALLFRHRRLR
ncbi:hypothetical protein CIG19_18935 [Enterobacterales bacterium CwR94]|nr:hypothetical protein CIG19_18935 [Enterobacterales bacterium CwR94]